MNYFRFKKNLYRLLTVAFFIGLTAFAYAQQVTVTGKVVDKFRAGMFSVELDVGKTVLATMGGRLRRNRIRVMNGDRVSLELSPYDLTRGRITYRHK